ncbi:hypothetical protein [Paenarthrobacter nitroguajacolicus]|uniref:hypothetical protein n=1 Tax=Paenarthrobacter nitroguajacolicus TaxID=211146 RepID=UPI003AF3F566
MLLLPFGGLTLALVFAFTGNVSNVDASMTRLETTEAQASANGLSLAHAMEQPISLVVQDGQKLVDNPLRYDYERAHFAFQALEGTNAIGTGLEMITFLVIPLLFFVYGCGVAAGDVRRRILKDRVVMQGASWYVVAKAATVVAVSLAAVLIAATLSLAAAPVLRAAFLHSVDRSFPYPVTTVAVGSPAVQIAFSASTAIMFGLLGLFVGLVARSMLIPSLAAGGLLMVAPFAGPYDPRNILTAAGQGVFNYWGGFSPRPPFPVEVEVGLAFMAGGLVFVALVSVLIWSRMTKFV